MSIHKRWHCYTNMSWGSTSFMVHDHKIHLLTISNPDSIVKIIIFFFSCKFFTNFFHGNLMCPHTNISLRSEWYRIEELKSLKIEERKVKNIQVLTLWYVFALLSLQSVKTKSVVRKLKTEFLTALLHIYIKAKTAIKVSKHSFYIVIW